jgi:putative salt-induced outer membrane protein YdiY
MRILHLNSLLLTALLIAQATASAAVVTLRNGDRVTGDVIESDAAKLRVNTEFLGEVEISWEAVTGIESNDPLHVSSSDGQVLVGPVATQGDAFQVRTANSGTVTVPKTEIAYVRNETAHLAYEAEIERLRNPRLTDFWRGFFDANLALTAGNAETKTFSNAAGATRETTRDTIKLYFTSLFAENSTTGESTVTANAIRGGSRYELNGTDKMFTYGFVDLEYDEFQSLDLRNVLGGGFGYHVVKNDRMRFDVYGGGAFNQEFFNNDITRRSAELTVGEEFNYTLTDRTSFNERLTLYPNLSQTGEYRLQFDTGLVTDVFRWMSWNVTFSDRFLSNPVNGREQNDILLTTGVRLVFGNEQLR